MGNSIFNTYEAVTPPKFMVDNIDITPPTTDLDYMDYIIPELDTEEPTKKKDTDKYKTEVFDPNWDMSIQQNPSNTLIDNIINTGRQFVGSKYVSGGTSPDTGFDCSGYLQYIFKQNGINIPRDTAGIFKTGKEVSLTNIRPGDIICTKGSGITGRHVQMVSRIDPNGQIYVLEAKGRKWGIVEEPFKNKSIISVRRIINQSVSDNNPFLVNTAIKAPKSFTNKQNFVNTLNAAYKRALIKAGLSPDYSEVLTAQAAFESGWGKHQAGTYNFGGIKAGKNQPGTMRTTKEYSPSRGYYTIQDKFRNFSSIDEYADYRIKLLSNRRYNLFRFNPQDARGMLTSMLNSGYGTAPVGDYVPKVMSIYNQIITKYA